MVRVLVLGQGMAGTIFAVGLEKIKRRELEPYGVPLADLNFGVSIDDVEIVASVDVDARKVNKTIYEVAKEFYGFERVPASLDDVRVHRGVEMGKVSDLMPVDSLDRGKELSVALEEFYEFLTRKRPDVIIDVTTTQYAEPFGTYSELERAVGNGRPELTPTQAYAYLALRYMREVDKLAYVNLIPVPVANDFAFVNPAKRWGGLVLGDDGATGATPFTADILEHLRERNRRVLDIVQFNIGGNTDFLALMSEDRNKAKETTKSSVVEDILRYEVPHYIRPTGYVESLGDKKFVSIHIEYISFNGAKDEVFVNMRINDSPALAGYMVDLARISALALESEIYGTIYDVNSFYMKKPGPPGSKNLSRILAYRRLTSFIKGLSREYVRPERMAGEEF